MASEVAEPDLKASGSRSTLPVLRKRSAQKLRSVIITILLPISPKPSSGPVSKTGRLSSLSEHQVHTGMG